MGFNPDPEREIARDSTVAGDPHFGGPPGFGDRGASGDPPAFGDPSASGVSAALVIGYGNALRSDDGVGWHAAVRLADAPRLAGAVVLARHQLTPELAADMAEASIVVLVDASTDGLPGAIKIRRLDQSGAGDAAGGDTMGRNTAGPSSHHVGPGLLLALARDLFGRTPPAFIVSVGTATIELGEELSEPVEAALPAVADAVAMLVAGTWPTTSWSET